MNITANVFMEKYEKLKKSEIIFWLKKGNLGLYLYSKTNSSAFFRGH